MFLANLCDFAHCHLLHFPLLLVIIEDTLIIQIEDAVCIDVELDIIQLFNFNCLEKDSMENFFHVECLVSHQDYVHLLLEEPVQEDVVATVGTRANQMEIVNYQQEVLICVFVEGLEVEYCSRLGFFENVCLEIGLMLLFNVLAVHYIDPALEKSSLDAHTAELLDEGGLSNSITTNQMDVFWRFRPCQLFENFINFLPFPKHTGIAFELKIDIVCLSETRRKIFEGSFDNFDDLLPSLMKINFDLLHFISKLRSQLNVNLLSALLVVFGIKQAFYQAFSDLYLVN